MAPSTNPYGRVRVKLPSGAETTVSRAYAKRHGLTVLSKDAVDTFGRTVRAKQRTDKAGRTVNASMTREALEVAATEAGVTPEDVAAARNKADLVDAIETINGGADGAADQTEEA